MTLVEKKTAKEAWEAVKTLCQGAEWAKKARIQTLKAEFESMNMKDTDSLDDFCLKMNGLVTNIRALGESVADSYIVKKLLRSVHAKFLQIASTIEQFGDIETMTIEETVGSLKAHEERLRGQYENNGQQLLLTEEKWNKRKKEENKLQLTREEWLKRSTRTDGSSGQRYRRKDSMHWVKDKSKVRCLNCRAFGHFAAECEKPKRDREAKEEVLIAEVPDEEPTLLMMRKDEDEADSTLKNESKVIPKLSSEVNKKMMESNLLYLDNGASNHMSGQRKKFNELDESVARKVKFGDNSVVYI